MSGPALAAVGVSYRVGDAVLVDGVDLEIRSGEILGLVGPNGAGKSTLIGMLAGETRSERRRGPAGRRYRSGTTAPWIWRCGGSVLPQSTVLQFAFRVLDVVMMGRYPHRDATPADDRGLGRNRHGPAAMSVICESVCSRRCPAASRPGSSFARVLAQETPIVLLDEPSASLDVRHQELLIVRAADARRLKARRWLPCSTT